MHEDALVDISTCFGRNCAGELDESARTAFLTLFRDHIEKGLNSEANLTWGDSRSRVLKWTKELAREVEERREGGMVTGDLLTSVSEEKIPGWQKTCVEVLEAFGPFCSVSDDGL